MLGSLGEPPLAPQRHSEPKLCVVVVGCHLGQGTEFADRILEALGIEQGARIRLSYGREPRFVLDRPGQELRCGGGTAVCQQRVAPLVPVEGVALGRSGSEIHNAMVARELRQGRAAPGTHD